MKWIKNPENWIPWTVFLGALAMVILSWMTIFFVEYGTYFNKDYQTSLFRRGERKQEGTLLEMDHIYVDGELVWDVDSTFDMKIGGMNFNFSRIVNADGEGYSFRVDEEKGALIRSQISGQEEKEVSTQEIPSRKDFMDLVFCLNLPVQGDVL